MLKCGITGSTGVLGKRIIEFLPYKFFPFKNKIENFDKVQNWVNSNRFDIIIHLAAIVPINKVNKNLKKAKLVNVQGTKNIIRAILNSTNPPKWFFYASTSHVYPSNLSSKKLSEKNKTKPYTQYGLTKRSGEKLVEKNFKNKKIKFCIGRIFSFTDKRQKFPFVIPSLISKIKNFKHKRITLYNLNHYRDFICTKDIANAIKLLSKHQSTGIYNIGSGYQISLELIASFIAKKFKKKLTFIRNKKSSYLISNSNKLKKLGWKPKKYKKNMSYFF